MKILIFGGTQFVGRHLTDAALVRGHTVTLFNRGITNPDLFPEVEKIHANRDGGLRALHGRRWDAVMDVNGYLPRIVGETARALTEQVGLYLFISTLSVYADFSRPGMNEAAPLATLKDPTTETIDGETYGGLKVLCEQAVETHFPNRSIILRLGYVVGPHDPTDRWTSWMRRVARGGEMLAPGDPDAPIQFIDGRDVARFAVRLLENQAQGVFVTTGPAERLTWAEMLTTARQVTGADTTFTWVSEPFLLEHKVEDELPMWSSSAERGAGTFDNRQAKQAGLEFLPLTATTRDTLAWDAEEGRPKAGLKPEREAELLRLWHARLGA